jgi:hypothetical protein
LQSGRPAFDDFNHPEDAIAAASKLDRDGEWKASINLYRLTALRWPEHKDYIQNCIDDILKKESLAQT